MPCHPVSRLLVAGALAALACPPTVSARNPWLFAYFKDSGKSGVYFALSEDGYRWKELNGGKAWIVPQEADELMRDPHLVRGPDGRFHMVWTWGWRTPGLVGYASSEDLVRWSGRRALAPMAGVEGLRNVWAPEIYWDDTKSRWLIIWSSTVDGRFPETAGQVDNDLNHRGYVAETADFQTLSPAEVFLDPGYPVIDATILRVGTKFHMVFKDERRNPLKKYLLSAEGPTLRGPWSGIRGPLTEAWAEGPSLVRVGQEYLLYYDHYQKPQQYRALRSRDLERWEDVTPKMSFPPGARHGSFLEITQEEARKLQDGPRP